MWITYAIQIGLYLASLLIFVLTITVCTSLGECMGDHNSIGKGFMTYEGEEAIELEKKL